MRKYLNKLLVIAILAFSGSHAHAQTLNIQVGFQQANDGSGDLLGALTYIDSPIFGAPSTLYTYIYGATSNPIATPYPIFTNDVAARSYYDGLVGPTFLSNANTATVPGTFTSYAIEAGTIMQVNSNWLQTNNQAPDYIIGKPTDDTGFTNGAGYITSSALSSYLTSSTASSTYATQSSLTSGLSAKQNTITVGTTSQYFRGDLSLATLPTSLPPSGTAGGDLTGSYPNPILATTSVTAGTYTYPAIVVDAKGRITSASSGTAPTVPKAFSGTTQLNNPIFVSQSGFITSGVVVFNFTSDGTSSGSSLFPNGPVLSTLNIIVNSSTAIFPAGWVWSNSNKTLTVTLGQSSATGVISLLGLNLLSSPTTAANGTAVNVSVWGN